MRRDSSRCVPALRLVAACQEWLRVKTLAGADRWGLPVPRSTCRRRAGRKVVCRDSSRCVAASRLTEGCRE